MAVPLCVLLWREHISNGIKLIMPAELELEIKRSRGVGEMFRALRHRNFLLFWSGAFLSNTGTWMQAVAQGWLVLQLTNSPFWLGFDGFMSTAPGLLLTLAGGESETCGGGGVFVMSAVASVAVPDAGVGSVGCGRVGLAAFALLRAFPCARARACATSAW